jgi:hypothetical protein
MSIVDVLANFKVNEADLRYLGGVCDVWGSVRIEAQNTKRPYQLLVFKSPFRDTLVAIQEASGGLGYLPQQATRPSKNQVRPHYSLRYAGADYLIFSNMVVPFMRVRARIERFSESDRLIRALREELGLKSAFRLPSREEDAASLLN